MLDATGATRAATVRPNATAAMLRLGLLFLSPDADGASGGGGAPSTAEREHRLRGDAAVQHQLTSTQRNPKIIAQRMQREIDRLWGIIEKGGVPEGHIVLNADQKKAWEIIKDMKLEDLKKIIENGPKLEAENAELKKVTERQKLARAAGNEFDSDALAQFMNDFKLNGEMREVEVEVEKDGKKTKEKRNVLHILEGEGDKAKAKPAMEFITNNYAVYKSSLLKKKGSSTDQPAGAVAPYGEQNAEGSSDTSDDTLTRKATGAYLKQRYAVPGKPAEK